MNDWLSLLICIIVAVQAIRYGLMVTAPAIIFASITWAYMFFLGDLGDYRHYFMGMILALFLSGFLSLLKKTDMVITLLFVCVVDIFLNGIGWILYENYFDPCWHEYLFVILYLYVITKLLTWEGGMRYGRCNNDDNWIGYIFPNINSCHYDISQCEKGDGA